MTINDDVFAALTAGSPVPLRAFPDYVPKYPTYPLVTWTVVGGEDDVHLLGTAGTARRVVQIDSWAHTRFGADQQIAAVKTLMLASTRFSVGAIDVSGGPTYEAETDLYRASLDFSIHYETP